MGIQFSKTKKVDVSFQVIENEIIKQSDLCDKYIDNIIEFKVFDDEKMSNIHNMSHEEKMKIIITYNKQFKFLISIIEREFCNDK
jgi:hypothetical protein